MYQLGLVGRTADGDTDAADFTVQRTIPLGAPLSRAQLRLLILLRDRVQADGYWPGADELAARLGRSRSVVCFHLRGLREKGYLTRGPGVKTYRLAPLDWISAASDVHE